MTVAMLDYIPGNTILDQRTVPVKSTKDYFSFWTFRHRYFNLYLHNLFFDFYYFNRNLHLDNLIDGDFLNDFHWNDLINDYFLNDFHWNFFFNNFNYLNLPHRLPTSD